MKTGWRSYLRNRRFDGTKTPLAVEMGRNAPELSGDNCSGLEDLSNPLATHYEVPTDDPVEAFMTRHTTEMARMARALGRWRRRMNQRAEYMEYLKGGGGT